MCKVTMAQTLDELGKLFSLMHDPPKVLEIKNGVIKLSYTTPMMEAILKRGKL